MSTQWLILEGKGVKVKIFFDNGLLDYIEIVNIKEMRKMKETITVKIFRGNTLDMKRKYDLIWIENVYQKLDERAKTYESSLIERYTIEDYTLNVLSVFNEQVGVHYREKILAKALDYNEAKEYIAKLLDYIDIVHTERKFHRLIEMLKESLNDVYEFKLT